MARFTRSAWIGAICEKCSQRVMPTISGTRTTPEWVRFIARSTKWFLRGRTVLPHKNHFVLRAIKRTHSGVVLVPEIVGITRCEHFSHMAPIHADLVNRAIGRVLAKRGVHAREKGYELAFAHF